MVRHLESPTPIQGWELSMWSGIPRMWGTEAAHLLRPETSSVLLLPGFQTPCHLSPNHFLLKFSSCIAFRSLDSSNCFHRLSYVNFSSLTAELTLWSRVSNCWGQSDWPVFWPELLSRDYVDVTHLLVATFLRSAVVEILRVGVVLSRVGRWSRSGEDIWPTVCSPVTGG